MNKVVNGKLLKSTITSQLNQLRETLYTGKWEVKASDQMQWFFYFRLGRLIWCEGGKDNDKKWQAYLKDYCPDLEINSTPQDKYEVLGKLFQERHLSKEDLTQFIRCFAAETILDLIQVGETEKLETYKTPDTIPNLLISLISLDPLLNDLEQVWQEWQEQGLSDYSVNSYLVIKDQIQLLSGNGAKLDPNLIKLIDGSLTLVRLAERKQENLIKLNRKLIPFIQTSAIALSSEPVLNTSDQQQNHHRSGSDIPTTIQPSKKVIACIDDSVGVCQQLKQSLIAASYEAMVFQDPSIAFSQLLKNPPDLILLDIMMPIISGYELCKQMRRTSKLKEVPIIILTGKDGWVDRAKAKMCGATDFLSKPVRKEKLFETINQYLSYPV